MNARPQRTLSPYSVVNQSGIRKAAGRPGALTHNAHSLNARRAARPHAPSHACPACTSVHALDAPGPATGGPTATPRLRPLLLPAAAAAAPTRPLPRRQPLALLLAPAATQAWLAEPPRVSTLELPGSSRARVQACWRCRREAAASFSHAPSSAACPAARQAGGGRHACSCSPGAHLAPPC